MHKDGAAVSEVDDALVVCAGNTCETLARVSHATPPILSPEKLYSC
jgi:hypothetical protein